LGGAPTRTLIAPPKTTIRARYSAGALHPLEALDLDEGEIVEIQVGKPPGKKFDPSDRGN
jgi:predicted DNA-binding antitoxin AbrB/MazE fold protein